MNKTKYPMIILNISFHKKCHDLTLLFLFLGLKSVIILKQQGTKSKLVCATSPSSEGIS